MTIDQKFKIRKCFDYKGQNHCEILDISDNEIYIAPNLFWDIEWVKLKEENKKYTLSWKWKGKEKEHIETNLTFTQVSRILNFYK